MKTYEEACRRDAKRMFSDYMGGGEPRSSNYETISFIYGKDVNAVHSYIWKLYKEMINDYYKTRKMP